MLCCLLVGSWPDRDASRRPSAVASRRGGNDQTVRLPDFTMIQSGRELLRLGWRPADPPRRLMLFVHPSSGNCAAQTAGGGRARDLGIEVMVLAPGEDLAALGRTGGGGGSLAAVPAVAATKEIPVVWVPAVTGTHNRARRGHRPPRSARRDRDVHRDGRAPDRRRGSQRPRISQQRLSRHLRRGPPARLPRRRDAIHPGDGAGGVGPLRPGTVAALWPVDGMMTTTGQVHRTAPAGSMSGLPRLAICRGRSLWPPTISGPRRHRG